MPTVSVPICFRELLRNICGQFSLPLPIYGSVREDADGLITIPVDVQFFGGDRELKSVRCLGGPCVSADQAEEDAAHRAIQKLRSELSFEVEDFNAEDKKYYEKLYTIVSADRSAVQKKYKQLRTDYNLLRRYYIDLLIGKERHTVDQEKKKGKSIAEASHQNMSAKNLRNVPAIPPGFE